MSLLLHGMYFDMAYSNAINNDGNRHHDVIIVLGYLD